MSTNFYWYREGEDVCDADKIGLRSAMGYYCWDCGQPLNRRGREGVRLNIGGHFKACPGCGGMPVREHLRDTSAGVELGFAMPRTERPTGVRTAAIFIWYAEQEASILRCRAGERVVSEYGEVYSGVMFLQMLEACCPIQFTHREYVNNRPAGR